MEKRSGVRPNVDRADREARLGNLDRRDPIHLIVQ